MAITSQPNSAPIASAQEFLKQEEIPGWLIYDYRQSNPIFRQVITPSGHVTRPCFLYVPSSASPALVVHHVDAGKFSQSGVDLKVFRNREEMVEQLTATLAGVNAVAMEYSPLSVLPRVSRVDAGIIELVRSLGVEVVSSADLMQFVTQRWTPQQLEEHRRSADTLGRIVNEAFQYVGDHLKEEVTEFQVAEFIRSRFKEEGLTSPDGPIVATNAHASDPHYEPEAQGSSVVRQGDWMLIDLWAKPIDPPVSPLSQGGEEGGLEMGGLEGGHNPVYADITWVAYVGDLVPQRQQEIFDIVTGARDAALKFLEDSFQKGESVQGWQADEIARNYIEERGYGQYFTHRLGHSIGDEVHSEAVNLDGFETHDTRRIIPGVGFSIEPGIYLPEFGVRSEIDAFMSDTGPLATSPVQREVVLIRG